jgi:hypothetical protein
MNNTTPKPLSYWLSYWAYFDTSRGVTRAVAKSYDEMISARQLAAVRGISNSQRINPDEECQRLFRCSVEKLNMKSASTFISYLKLDRAERERAA